MKTHYSLLLAAALAAAEHGAPRVDRMRADLDFLCSDALEGRLSLDKSADVAAQYIAAEFQKAGLRPADGSSYMQRFPLIAYRPDRAATSLLLQRGGTTEAFQPGVDFRISHPRDVTLAAPVVFAGYGITAPEYGYDDYAGIDARGKAVLIFEREPQENDAQSVFNGTGQTRHGQARVKMLNARRHGALAVLLAGNFAPPATTASGQAPRATAPLQALDDTDSIPVISVRMAAAERLLAASGKTAPEWRKQIDSSGKPASRELPDTAVQIRGVNAETRRGMSANVAGWIEGADPALRNETILLTAHHDHLGVRDGKVYAGANDNASGTVAVMELARLFAAEPARPRRTILFIVFGSEEEGLLGSFYYTDHPLRPLETTRTVLNLDMVARNEAHIPQSERAFQLPPDTSNALNLVAVNYSPQLERLIAGENRQVGLDLSTKFDRDHILNVLYRCDHFPFLMHGIPSVWLFGGFHPGYHEPSDTVANLNFTKLEKVTRLTYLTAEKLAAGEPPPRFRP